MWEVRVTYFNYGLGHWCIEWHEVAGLRAALRMMKQYQMNGAIYHDEEEVIPRSMWKKQNRKPRKPAYGHIDELPF
jgi:hypothetical protein